MNIYEQVPSGYGDAVTSEESAGRRETEAVLQQLVNRFPDKYRIFELSLQVRW